MLDFQILVHSFLLHSTKSELLALGITVVVIIVASFALAAREIRKRKNEDAQ